MLVDESRWRVNRHQMLIDLTPLLDVILIILFMVLVSNQSMNAQEVENLQAQVSRLEQSQLPQTPSQKAWQISFAEDIDKLNLVYHKVQDQEEIYLITAEEERLVKPASEDLTKWLQQELDRLAKDVVMISFTYDDHQIYYRDYRNLVEAINQLNQIQDKKIIYSEYPEDEFRKDEGHGQSKQEVE